MRANEFLLFLDDLMMIFNFESVLLKPQIYVWARSLTEKEHIAIQSQMLFNILVGAGLLHVFLWLKQLQPW